MSPDTRTPGGKYIISFGAGLLLGAAFGGPRPLGLIFMAVGVLAIIAGISYQIGVEDRTIWRR